MPQKQFKKSFAAQGRLEKEREERSIRERESHLKAKTYLEHLAADFILKTVVFEDEEQLPPHSEMKDILVMALKSSLARQKSETITTTNSTPNTIYSEIERHIDDYTDFLISVLKREISKAKKPKPTIEFNVKQVKKLDTKQASQFSDNLEKFSVRDLITE